MLDAWNEFTYLLTGKNNKFKKGGITVNRIWNSAQVSGSLRPQSKSSYSIDCHCLVSTQPFLKLLAFYTCNMATTAGHHSTPRDQINGILPVTASQTAGNASKVSVDKSTGPRLKVVIRRLAPGLTEAEFIKLLGDDWKLGQGRVDWFSYKQGKDSQEYVFAISNCQVRC